MKKLLSIAALILAMSPLAQAQNAMNHTLADYPNARNDRSVETMSAKKKMKHQHKHKAGKHHHRHHAHAAKK